MTALLADGRGNEGFVDHGLVVDEGSREVFLAGKYVELTRTEFDLLVILHRNPRRVLTPEVLLAHIWHSDFVEDGHPIEVYIHRLRRKLGESGRHSHYIHTVRGVGYRFEPDADDNGHIELVYDGLGVLREVRPARSHLWGVPLTQLLGTTFNPVAAMVDSTIHESDGPANSSWRIHVSCPSTSSS